MFAEQSRIFAELEAPFIPDALENGILPIEFLSEPVKVTLKVWEGARPGYTYQLNWNGLSVGPEKPIIDEEPGATLTLEIPVNLLVEGRHEVAYVTKNPVSEITVTSRSATIEIDRTAPGNPLLAPIIFPPAIKDGLTSDELDAMGNVLPGLIASYHDMKEGDVIRSYWGTVEGPVAVVDKDDMGLKRVMVDFTRAFLEAIGDIEAPVYYTVTDLAGNLSTASQVLQVNLQLQVLPVLPLPVVKEANGDTLDPADAVNGATVVVGASAQLRSGDRVAVQWVGPKGSDSKEKMISDADAGKDMEVVFSTALVEVNKGQTIGVFYTVIRGSGSEQSSETLSLNIQSGHTQLPAPTLDTVGPDGLLDPSKIPDSGATVRVSYDGMSTGDTVSVGWRGATSYDTPTQVIGGNVELQFNVPKPYINQSIGGSASVTYTVTRSGTAQVSTPLWLQVKQGLDFDTSPVTLDGKIYLLISYPDLLPAFPANTTAQRSASGGQAPYTYSSSDLKVAHVDQDGLTSVRGKGIATISVTDALGATATYQVTVTGVIHCLGFGGGTLARISAAAANEGARVPAIGELNEIFNAYGSRWPMGNGWYWSSTVAAANIAGMKWYFVKNLNSGANYKLLEHKSSLGIGIR
jgi:hypothetical protein